VELDGQAYHSAMLDFGPELFSGWLTSLVGLELGVEREDVLDVEARELVLDGQRIGLTPLEFDVMRYLHQREGEVVTRISLLEDVWGYDYTGGSNVVDARVWSLRKKLGEHAEMIETVPGAGYRFRRA
jgi:two-component system alkaline phosphatase synthesis response regulator PhoP